MAPSSEASDAAAAAKPSLSFGELSPEIGLVLTGATAYGGVYGYLARLPKQPLVQFGGAAAGSLGFLAVHAYRCSTYGRPLFFDDRKSNLPRFLDLNFMMYASSGLAAYSLGGLIKLALR
eukprot:TRINITY_DN82223_c0_g1_i1.p1 TRINITY_DN82223_c0_g1~~TRINITY_DN82223_c0_g1_i1.p1  ORF type:complete len:120 (-),score=26.18 TRINITY_DN82223_c0_g1_i1:311-670(-)